MKFGLIGCGTVAEFGHLPALTALPEAELVAVTDLNWERAAHLGAEYGCRRICRNYQELLAIPEIEAVVVATPVDTHYEIVLAAARAGKHVLCEKPIAENVERGREMTRVMHEAGLILGINFLLRESEPLVTIKEWVEAGRIGEIAVMRFVFNSAGPGWISHARLETLITRGLGPIFDCGVHYFDLARWLTGSEYETIQAMGVHLQGYANPDHVITTCRLANGAMALIEESWIYTLGCAETKRYRHYEVIGSRGTITYHTDTEELALFTPEGTERRQVPKEQKAFTRVYHNFITSIKQGYPEGVAPGEDGVQAVAAALTALAAIRAEEAGKGESKNATRRWAQAQQREQSRSLSPGRPGRISATGGSGASSPGNCGRRERREQGETEKLAAVC